MSVSEFPSEDSETRQRRAEQTNITEVRTISGEAFGVPDDYTVYEVDLVNDSGESRENVVIIPRILFENTKDVQHRHEAGIVGKDEPVYPSGVPRLARSMSRRLRRAPWQADADHEAESSRTRRKMLAASFC